MSYSKQTWDTNSYVNPTRMNHIEDGIEAADNAASAAGTATGTSYNNTSSGLSATTVQGAIDEVQNEIKKYANVNITADTTKISRYSDLWGLRDSRSVELSFGFSAKVASSTWEKICSIPAASAPSLIIYFIIWDSTSNSPKWMYLNPQGEIGIFSPTNEHSYFGFVSFLASTFS